MKHRFVIALAAAGIVAAGVVGCSQAPSPRVGEAAPQSSGGAAPQSSGGGATQIMNVVAVNSAGQPANGYREAPPQGNISEVDCTTAGGHPSPAAVADDIYYCSPSAASADVCWPAGPGSLLCLDNPWSQQVHRVRYNGVLPHVQPTATPLPFALLLDDGSTCRLRNGGAWGKRYDDLRGFYRCTGPAGQDVLAPKDTDPIDHSSPVWTVRVGLDSASDPSSPPPVTHSVVTAWFAAN
jgi:hypothetical protein